MSTPTKTLKLGIIGCVEITQVVFISTIGCLRDYYRITYLCDSSHDALQHCRGLVAGASPYVTHDARELVASPDVDVVMVMSSYEDHVAHTVMALEHNKFVIVEKPLAMSLEDADAIITAEKKSSARVFVGYIRRYAPAFLDALNEIGGMDKIDYVRVRGIPLWHHFPFKALRLVLTRHLQTLSGPTQPSSRRAAHSPRPSPMTRTKKRRTTWPGATRYSLLQ